jgi:hypothetical protein
MQLEFNPDDLSPDELRHAVAEIFATSVCEKSFYPGFSRCSIRLIMERRIIDSLLSVSAS